MSASGAFRAGSSRLALARWGVALGVCYAVLWWQSRSFELGTPPGRRCIWCVLAVLAAAFVFHLRAAQIALRLPDDRIMLRIVVGFAVAFRILLLPSAPILEVDLYRYVWDGFVVAHGENPYRYAPATVIRAWHEGSTDARLAWLAEQARSDRGIAEVLTHVHYAGLPTVYPPVSQAVFALAELTTPSGASLPVRRICIKSWLVLFDLLSLAILLALLSLLRVHRGCAILYGWCPLVLKEVANSGHLDSIAVCLTLGAIWLAVRSTHRRSCFLVFGSAVLLGLAVGAKLYPVVLVPVWSIWLLRKLGWRSAVPAVFLWAGVAGISLAPWAMAGPGTSAARVPPSPLAVSPPVASVTDPHAGIKQFLRRWEINDWMFLIAFENLTPRDADQPQPWFRVLPEEWAGPVRASVPGRFASTDRDRAFFAARLLTLVVWGTLAMTLAVWLTRGPTVVFLRAVFLTLAWFWLLCPTQNPWYWLWPLPLVALMPNPAWRLMSGLVLIYYLRFWLATHYSKTLLFGTPYNGVYFFDYVVTWLEYTPWLGVLLVWRFTRGKRPHKKNTSRQSKSARRVWRVDG